MHVIPITLPVTFIYKLVYVNKKIVSLLNVPTSSKESFYSINYDDLPDHLSHKI